MRCGRDDRVEGLYLLIDRWLSVKSLRPWDRLGESVETAFEGRGTALGYRGDEGWSAPTRALAGVQQYLREADGRVFQEPSPQMFSFTNPIGACP